MSLLQTRASRDLARPLCPLKSVDNVRGLRHSILLPRPSDPYHPEVPKIAVRVFLRKATKHDKNAQSSEQRMYNERQYICY